MPHIKKYYLTVVIVLLISTMPQHGHASGWSGERFVTDVTVAENGWIVVTLDSNSTTTESCQVTNRLLFANNVILKSIHANALTALVTKKRIGSWIIGCTELWGQTYLNGVNLKIFDQ